jgi:hypothetical protein
LQEATQAVAEVERKKREKRKRQSLRSKGRNGNALSFDGHKMKYHMHEICNCVIPCIAVVPFFI